MKRGSLGFGERMDRISDLPDGIIIKILSFLSIDEAASTSILSKRWRDLFAFTPNHHFSLTFRKKNLFNLEFHQNFIDFVERVLAVSGDSAIRSFSLDCRDDVKPAHTDRWIRHVLRRGGVLDLDLDVDVQDSLLFEVFACKTLVNLKLGEVRIPMLPENASLPALKSLSLLMVQFDNLGAFKKLISACPLLEELIYLQYGCELLEGSHFLSGPTLKRLTTCSFSDELGNMSFDHPNLVYLDYSGFIQRQYPVVNLDSLVEAKLNILKLGKGRRNGDPSNLIKGLRNVKFLSLSFPRTVEIFGKFHEAVPVFENLIHLSIRNIYEEFCIFASSLPFLLKKCPNLQTLVIEGTLGGHGESEHVCPCFSGNSRILLSPVKVLQVTTYKGSTRELGQIKRFLEDLSCLELVKVSATAKDEEKLRITTDLHMLPRASSKCRIQVQFS